MYYWSKLYAKLIIISKSKQLSIISFNCETSSNEHKSYALSDATCTPNKYCEAPGPFIYMV